MDTSNSPSSGVEFRAAPTYRRTARLAFVGSLLCIGTLCALWKFGFVGRKLIAGIPLPGLAICAGLAGGVWSWRQRLRVDDLGLWRRRFVHWDLWPWEAFEDGRIHEGLNRHSFLFPDKSWYWRELALEVLTEQDRASVRETIDLFWERPLAPEIPKELEIQGGGLFRSIRFSDAGISYAHYLRSYRPVTSWTDLPFVELTLTDHSSKQFRQLRIGFPGKKRPITLYVYAGKQNWRGADPQLIAAVLKKHVPPSRLWINAQEGAPLDQAEHERRIAKLKKSVGTEKRMLWFGFLELIAVLLFLWFFVFAKNGANPRQWDLATWLLISLMAALFLPMPFVIWFMALDIRKDRNKSLSEQRSWQANAAENADDSKQGTG